MQTKHEVVVKQCSKCKKDFSRRTDLNNHYCTRAFDSVEKFTRYHLRPIGTLVQLLAQRNQNDRDSDDYEMEQEDPNVTPKFSALQLHELCTNGMK